MIRVMSFVNILRVREKRIEIDDFILFISSFYSIHSSYVFLGTNTSRINASGKAEKWREVWFQSVRLKFHSSFDPKKCSYQLDKMAVWVVFTSREKVKLEKEKGNVKRVKKKNKLASQWKREDVQKFLSIFVFVSSDFYYLLSHKMPKTSFNKVSQFFFVEVVQSRNIKTARVSQNLGMKKPGAMKSDF